MLNTINLKYPNVIVSEAYKKNQITGFTGNTKTEASKRRFKNINFKFPKYFPHISRVFSCDKMIYISRKFPNTNKSEFIVMTKQGKIIKKMKLKRGRYGTFNDGVYYYLLENEDEEEWELFSQKIL